MTFRYNPQAIEKQVRKWPVLLSEMDLHKDICNRVNQLFDANSCEATVWLNPFQCQLPFDKDFIYEYGNDACRLATILAGSQNKENLLEPSFKWIAKLHDSLSKPSAQKFNPKPWLEAAIQLKDHIIQRNNARLALALVMKAFKDSSPNSEITECQKQLITASLQPFIPIYVATRLITPDKLPLLPNIVSKFEEYICIKIALERSGWHWEVFNKSKFQTKPEEELLKIKWINKAVSKKKILLKEENGGVRVCFS